jgi:hypothetical protein
MSIDIGTKEVHFHYNLLTFDITFVFYDGMAINRCSWNEDVSTTSVRGDVWGRDVTRRRSHRLKEDQDQTSRTLSENRWALRPQMNVDNWRQTSIDILTPKTSWRLKSIKSTSIDSQIAAIIFMCMSETKRERVAHWLSVFNIVIFYFDKLW